MAKFIGYLAVSVFGFFLIIFILAQFTESDDSNSSSSDATTVVKTTSVEDFEYQYGVEILAPAGQEIGSKPLPLLEGTSSKVFLRKDELVKDCLITLDENASYLVTCQKGSKSEILNPVNDKPTTSAVDETTDLKDSEDADSLKEKSEDSEVEVLSEKESNFDKLAGLLSLRSGGLK